MCTARTAVAALPSLLSGAEDDDVGQLERALQPCEGIGLKVAVGGNGSRHHGMGELHQQGTATAEQENGLSVDAADDRVVREETRAQATVSTRP